MRRKRNRRDLRDVLTQPACVVICLFGGAMTVVSLVALDPVVLVLSLSVVGAGLALSYHQSALRRLDGRLAHLEQRLRASASD